ncbi:MAG: hypothetical protein MJK04_13940 [Psychrosphaera sp.]|nr:hypothetical protein [Psychrosphaera sp.]
MIFTIFEVAAVLVTLTSASVNIVQYILSRKSKSLHIADMDGVYTTAYRAVENIDIAIAASKNGEDPIEYIQATKSAINAVREKCQNRIYHIERRLPETSKPWDSSNIKS